MRTNLRLLSVLSKKRAVKKALRLFCTPFYKSKIKTSPLFEQAEKLDIYIDNKKVVGYRWNHPQSKKFLILHGFHSAAKKFERYVSPMISKGYEVLAFDAPAHGDSEGSQTNVLEYRKLVEEVNTRFGPIHAFLAHSFGGLAASLALERIPHSTATKLVLIAPVTETSTAVDLLFSFLHLRNNLRKQFENLILSVGGVTVQWLSTSRAIKNIQAQTLWIHDEDDEVTPFKDLEPLMKSGYPNIQFLITKGLGHRRVYHDQKVMKAIMEFFND
jgi:pimeloyl-ACP methyl ester carboxylesterase